MFISYIIHSKTYHYMNVCPVEYCVCFMTCSCMSVSVIAFRYTCMYGFKSLLCHMLIDLFMHIFV